MSHIPSPQTPFTCDTHDKIRTAQRKLIKDSRELIRAIKKYKPTIKREGMTRSIHYSSSQLQPELLPKYIVNSYARKFLTKYLLNAIYFTFDFTNTNDKQTAQAIQDIRATLARMGYKLAPAEQRLVNTQIYRHEARVFNLNGTQLRVDICDYAIRPIYIGGYLSLEARPQCEYMESFKCVREATLQTMYTPEFDSRGYYNGYHEVPRSFYDEATRIEAPELYHPSHNDDFFTRMRNDGSYLSRWREAQKQAKQEQQEGINGTRTGGHL